MWDELEEEEKTLARLSFWTPKFLGVFSEGWTPGAPMVDKYMNVIEAM